MSCGWGDGDEGIPLGSVWRRARKPHTCCACRETIPRGHRYHVWSIVFPGYGKGSFKHCARCWLLADFLLTTTQEPIDVYLDCGHEWDDPDAPEQALAFLTPEEAQQQITEAA